MIPAGLFVDLDAEREPCVWQAAPAVGVTDPQLVARRCDVTPTAWAILEAAARARQPAGPPATDPYAVGDSAPPVYVGRGMWHQPREGVPLLPGRTTP